MERREYSPDELRNKAEAYCARAERCPMQMRHKLYEWGADSSMQSLILEHLEAQGYIDTARYCRAFVHDHRAINRWPDEKIIAKLYQLGLPGADIRAAITSC